MAQTIKIKRSTGSSAPSTLANGELAYLNNSTTKKLYIGRPGGGTGDIDIIGGKYYTDVIDARTANSEAAVATTTTSGRTYKVQKDSNDHSVVNVPWVDNPLALASSTTRGGVKIGYTESGKNYPVELDAEKMYVNVPWTDTSGDNKLPLAGGTLTGALYGTSATFSGELTADSLNLLSGGTDGSILNVDTIGCDQIIGDADNNTSIKFAGSETIEFRSNGDLEVTIDESCLKLRTGTSINEFSTDVNLAGDSDDAVPTEKAVKAYVDASVPTSVATATTATNVTLSADNSTNASHFIPFANSATGSQGLQTDNALSYNPSTNGLSVGTSGNIATGTLSVATSIHGPSTFYIDPAPDDTGEVGGSTTDTGTVVILGDLRVTGETTTVNSTTVTVGDNIIRLNADLASDATPTHDAGIEVDRGGSSDVGLFWDESALQWVVSDASGVGPYQYPILQTRTAHLQTYTIDGGSF